jgi:hypothetical protein
LAATWVMRCIVACCAISMSDAMLSSPYCGDVLGAPFARGSKDVAADGAADKAPRRQG